MKNSEEVIRVIGLSKSFGQQKVLSNINLSIKKKEIIAIIGPSGCGKTTLLRCINGLELPDDGIVRVLGFELPTRKNIKPKNNSVYKSIDELRKDIGMVFQHLYLWPHKTIKENIIEAPLTLGELTKSEAERKVKELLARVGLSDKENDYPHTLSGGQQQRVAVARALAMEPQILLLDEITSALDPELVSNVLELIKELTHQGDRTMIIVTHEMRFARDVSHRILFMNEGSILEDATPELFFTNPKSTRAKEFLSRVTRIRK